MNTPLIRSLDSRDSFAELTDLIHRSYAPLAAAGLRFLGSHQDEATTRERCGRGECWVVEKAGRIIGTITWRHDPSKIDPTYYQQAGVAVFGQFAVDPNVQRSGIGSRLLSHAETRARESGFVEMACDTAAGAEGLVAFYLRRGYRVVGSHRWEATNYESMLLSKALTVRDSQTTRK
jgi:GNAT superfamily N-acetyltransferase